MIRPSDCIAAGKINKTHGLDGELSISFFDDAVADALKPGSCLVLDIDGILTPFFVRTVRPRSAEARLIAFDGIDSQEQASAFTGLQVYAPKSEHAGADEDADGFYAGMLIGYTALDEANNSQPIGVIMDIDDATDNALFIIQRPDGTECRIPIVDDFIVDISPDNKTIEFSLPPGLLEL